ncbi:hypothetical protein [Achromobacter xylosoxidans]|uniref:hypothetical protein n=1 Tax=Alcaligenes xylosoxydans xylosoxydans TaxID=85698 RepID=UPI0013AF2BD8|nr:hypothetical protein [Achromobacter xylosoxidans]
MKPAIMEKINKTTFFATLGASLFASVISVIIDKPALGLLGVTVALIAIVMLCCFILDALHAKK